MVAETIVVDYNEVDLAAAAVERHSEDLAAVFVEPVAGNMGCVPPAPGFLEALRALCDVSGALLVFDEVITGFRVARGGAQERYGVLPDLTVLGKIVGGGLPLAAFGGRAEIMSRLAPAGDVYQAGTLSGNPLATAAGLSVLRRLRDPAVYEELERRGAQLEAGLAPYGRVQRVGAMLTLFAGRDAAAGHADEAARYRALRGALPPPARPRASTSLRASTSASSPRSPTAAPRSRRRRRRLAVQAAEESADAQARGSRCRRAAAGGAAMARTRSTHPRPRVVHLAVGSTDQAGRPSSGGSTSCRREPSASSAARACSACSASSK